MNTKETLIQARALIENPKNWCQRDLAQDAEGRCTWLSKACKFCAIGAISKVEDGKRQDSPAYQALVKVVGSENVGRYNDSHTHAEVLDLFDKAIQNEDQNM